MIIFKELTVFKQIDSFPQIVSFMFGVSKFDQEMISNLSIADVHILSWQKSCLKNPDVVMTFILKQIINRNENIDSQNVKENVVEED